MRKIPPLFIPAIFLTLSLSAQGPKPLSPTEKSFLDIIWADTVSNAVSYLPRQFSLGIEKQSDRYLVLLKQGKLNYFLVEATNQVYLLQPGSKGPELARQDKTVFEGDNYLMMAFLRNDTICQFGGYGFWKVRDFFSHYAYGLREWEFNEGWEGIEAMYTWNFYDRRDDRFYLVGRHTKDPLRGKHLIIHDSIYAYDFSRRSFKTLGKITAIDWRNEHTAHIGNMSTTPFGLVILWAKELRLIDFGRNGIYRVMGPKRDSINLALQRYYAMNGPWSTILFLNDRLLLITGDDQRSFVQEVPLSKADFDTANGMALYAPVSSTAVNSPVAIFSRDPFLVTIILVAIASLVSFFAGRKGMRKNYSSSVPAGIDTHQPIAQPGIFKGERSKVTNSSGDLGFFLQSLPPVERELLKEMVRYSMQERKMEIDVINKILGVSSKDSEIQKARRSNAITHINNSFTQITRTNGLLIRRERDDIDKRVYVYFVADEMAKLLADM